MKLRLAAHALRLRILRSELTALEAGRSLHESVRIAPGITGCITYTLAIGAPEQQDDVAVSCVCGEVEVRMSFSAFKRWCNPEEVGMYAQVASGEEQPLEVIVEKDFACLDRSDAENQDAFEHPHAGVAC